MTVHSITRRGRGNPPPAPLSESQRAVLALALDDATTHRAVAFSSRCTACDRSPAALCSEHAAAVDRIDDYLDLATTWTSQRSWG